MRYRSETKVTVHYNAKDPKIAVLETGITGSNVFKIVIGALMTLIGGWIGFRSYRNFQEQPIAPGTGF